jgi:GTPase SAR1 family protein
MGIMLVYDITNSRSFDNITKWLRNIDEHAQEDVVKMIIGNKCDMDDKRVISVERGMEISKHHNIQFLETSAKTNVNIDQAFYDITKRILERVSFEP